jgi:hypothetical protein
MNRVLPCVVTVTQCLQPASFGIAGQVADLTRTFHSLNWMLRVADHNMLVPVAGLSATSAINAWWRLDNFGDCGTGSFNLVGLPLLLLRFRLPVLTWFRFRLACTVSEGVR